MTNSETNTVARSISEASQKVEECAVQVAQRRVDHTELTTKVVDSAAKLSDYILTRARKPG